jgi:HEAT repeat protein
MTSLHIAFFVVVAVFSLDLVLLLGLITLKTVHRRRVVNHDRRRVAYVALLSRHLGFEYDTDPVTKEMATDEAFLDAIIDLRNTVAGPEVEKLALMANRYGLIERQTRRLASRFPLRRRLRAAVSLAEMGDESSAHALIKHLDDREPEIRIQSARGLGRMNHIRAIDLIVERLEKETPWVRARFADTLLGFSSKASRPLLAYVEANHACEDPSGVIEVVRVLGAIGDREAGPALTAVLDESDNPEVEIALVSALGSIGGPLSIPSLVAALHSPDWRVRAKAATAFGEIGDPEVIPDLDAALRDQNWWVRRNSAAALTRLPGGLDTLYTALVFEDHFARDAAAEALADAGELNRARAHHEAGMASHDELRLLRHMRGEEVVPA